ncbi:DUF5398 family protein [Chlamydiales bacterium]|nr:DUF5398 family protein [Chlamydiales bacterium]
MFGLEDKGKEVFLFDLEEEFLDSEKRNKLNDHIHGRLYKIKAILRSGEIQEDFEKLGHLIYGYASLLKVMSRVAAPKS